MGDPIVIAAWSAFSVAVIAAVFSGVTALIQQPRGSKQRQRIETQVNGNASRLQDTIDRQHEHIRELESRLLAQQAAKSDTRTSADSDR